MCSNSETKPFYGHFTFIALPLFVVFLFVSPSSSREAPHKGCQLYVVMHITPTSYSSRYKLSPNCSVAELRPANVMINIFTRSSSPSICPNCSLSKCISSPPGWLVRMPSPSLTPISITVSSSSISLVSVSVSISASVPGQGWCLTAWCRNGRGSSQWEGEDGGNQTINGPSPSPGQDY